VCWNHQKLYGALEKTESENKVFKLEQSQKKKESIMRNLMLGFVLGIVLTAGGTWAGSGYGDSLERLEQKQQLDRIEQQNQEILRKQRQNRLNPC